MGVEELIEIWLYRDEQIKQDKSDRLVFILGGNIGEYICWTYGLKSGV